MGEYSFGLGWGIPSQNILTENNKLKKFLNNLFHDIIYKQRINMNNSQTEAFHLSLIRWFVYGSTIYKYNDRKDEISWIPDRTDEAMSKFMNKRNPVNNPSFQRS